MQADLGERSPRMLNWSLYVESFYKLINCCSPVLRPPCGHHLAPIPIVRFRLYHWCVWCVSLVHQCNRRWHRRVASPIAIPAKIVSRVPLEAILHLLDLHPNYPHTVELPLQPVFQIPSNLWVNRFFRVLRTGIKKRIQRARKAITLATESGIRWLF